MYLAWHLSRIIKIVPCTETQTDAERERKCVGGGGGGGGGGGRGNFEELISDEFILLCP